MVCVGAWRGGPWKCKAGGLDEAVLLPRRRPCDAVHRFGANAFALHGAYYLSMRSLADEGSKRTLDS